MYDIHPYQPKNPLRVVTATSLFDGHDASINIMRRILQASGAEIIHLGHNLSAEEIVNCAVQEDAQAIAVTSYQGGHIEFFKYMYDLLKERNREDIRIFGGGGGVILPEEIEELHQYGIARIYSPDDGRAMGLQGMINDLLQKSDFPRGNTLDFSLQQVKSRDYLAISRCISAFENYPENSASLIEEVDKEAENSSVPVLGITGTGGAGKSSLVDEFVRRFLLEFPEKKIAIVCVDPTRRRSGGALLGDRIRMNSVTNPRVFVRSMATRQANLSLSRYVKYAVNILKTAGFDLIILETSGIGQADTEIIDHSNMSLYVMTPEYGAASQLEKIDMLDFADVVALNKFDKRGGLDALRDVKKQYQRNHKLFDRDPESMPVFGTIASQFNDPGVNQLFYSIVRVLKEKTSFDAQIEQNQKFETPEKIHIIPPQRVRYLAEISETVRNYNTWSEQQAEIAQNLYSINTSLELLKKSESSVSNT